MHPGAQNTALVQGREDDGCCSKKAVGIRISVTGSIVHAGGGGPGFEAR